MSHAPRRETLKTDATAVDNLAEERGLLRRLDRRVVIEKLESPSQTMCTSSLP